MEDIKRKLSKDIDIGTMLTMREQGMTNKQIANALGVAPTTVYRYIGRMSQAVKYAEITNKPSPIGAAQIASLEVNVPMPDPVKADSGKRNRQLEKIARQTTHTTDSPTPPADVKQAKNGESNTMPATDHIEEKTMEKKTVKSAPAFTPAESGSLLRVISTRSTLQGSLCNYIVDSDSGSIEMTDGIITGLLDRETVHRFIAELHEACKLLG